MAFSAELAETKNALQSTDEAATQNVITGAKESIRGAREERRRDNGPSGHVTRNWRLTLRIEAEEVFDVNLEDYH